MVQHALLSLRPKDLKAGTKGLRTCVHSCAIRSRRKAETTQTPTDGFIGLIKAGASDAHHGTGAPRGRCAQ